MRLSAHFGTPVSTGNTLYCLLLSSCFGAIWGGIAGAIYGGFLIPFFGNLVGLFLGAFGGWVAGLVGVVINHRIGYKIGGVIGSLFCSFIMLRPQSLSDVLTLKDGPIGVYKFWEFVVPIGIAFLLGLKVDKDLGDTDSSASLHPTRVMRNGAKTSGARPYQWLRELLAQSTLVEWSLEKRIFWACAAVFVHGFFVLRVLPQF